MLGNDVVDLCDADARPDEASRFDARVFCESERASLAACPRRARRRWQLWAAKEAAYKAAVRRDPSTIFSPSRLRVHLPVHPPLSADGDGALEVRGIVETPVGDLPVRVFEQDGAVHALVCTEPKRTVSGMTRLTRIAADPDAPSREVRRLATDRLAAHLGVPRDAIEIRKQGRIPALWVDGRRYSALSLSHHGEVVGFACEVGLAG